MNLKITIIIPVFNKEMFIENSIMSVLSQDYENFEVIVIDDSSEDDSYNILKNLQIREKNNKLLLLKNNINKGVSYSRNRGISVATGDYIIFLDADDEISSSQFFNNIARVVSKYNAKYILTTRNYYDKFNRPSLNSISKYLFELEKDTYIVKDKQSTLINGGFPLGGSASAVFSIDLLSDLRFQIDVEKFEDWLFFTPLFFKTDVFYLSNEMIYINYDEKSLSRRKINIGNIAVPEYYTYLDGNKSYNKIRKTFFWMWLNSIISKDLTRIDNLRLLIKFRKGIFENLFFSKVFLKSLVAIIIKLIS
ncbi:glycosyltransferase family 2 protein [Alkalibacterium olivapovliticus]|nr:glycosyltransferase family 2 protein [Alkalibacterium olivapovliticus]